MSVTGKAVPAYKIIARFDEAKNALTSLDRLLTERGEKLPSAYQDELESCQDDCERLLERIYEHIRRDPYDEIATSIDTYGELTIDQIEKISKKVKQVTKAIKKVEQSTSKIVADGFLEEVS